METVASLAWTRPFVLFRTDANARIGSGHLMRCLALAQAVRAEGDEVRFLVSEDSASFDSRIAAVTGFPPFKIGCCPGDARDLNQTLKLTQHLSPGWVVLDGYQFGPEFSAALKQSKHKVLVIDDLGQAGPYTADLVLNQNTYASEAIYADRESYTDLLLGPRFALLRTEFANWRGWHPNCKYLGRNVLLTMGGADPPNATRSVLCAMRHIGLPDLHVKALLGAANAHRESIKEAAGKVDFKVEVIESITEMAELMAWADVAISAAGSTCWELTFMGLPALLISLAENQVSIGRSLDALGAACYLGDVSAVIGESIACRLKELLDSCETRARMSNAGRTLVDGQGARRVACRLRAAHCRSHAVE
jgi:UDP-2,4-diacetamido-2,4,6-trideoxy-beta-L-altropyranose hydrolase